MGKTITQLLSSDNLWATFGKVALLITMALGIVQLYTYFSPSSSSLEAIATEGTVELKSLPVYSYLLAELERGEIKDKRLEGLLTFNRTKYNYLLLNIANVGKIEANDVVVKLPAAKSYKFLAVEVNGKTLKQSDISDEILVGNIKPAMSTEVLIWDELGIVLIPRDIIVSHRNGSTKVEVTRSIHGIQSKIVNLLEPWSIWFTISVCWLFIASYKVIKTAKRTAVISPDQPTKSP